MRRRTSRTPITLMLTAVLLAGLCVVPTAPLSAAPAVPFRSTGLDGGGLVNVVAFDPWTPGVVIAGGDNSGFYRSTDNGQTWTPQNAGIAGPGDTTGFRVRYLMGSTDVTAQVWAGTFRTPTLAPGSTATLTLTVTTLPGSRGRMKDVLVRATSVGRQTLIDAVLARVTVR